ncbi:MAG TPA: hypothetical protein VNK43_00610 [Gemmatimonadales bacterium]|nr:hypothetical protein [Gemmatimonadales bacterium]
MNAAKQALSFVGIALALLGIAWESRTVVWGAIAALSGAVLLRLVARARAARRARSGEDSPES